MLVKLENPVVLSKVVDIISELVAEVRIKVGEFGMSITAVDPANVAMIGFKLPRIAFSQFEVGSETLGVNLDNLKKILKRCGSGSALILSKQENTLEIQIIDRVKRTFKLGLIDIDKEEKEMPSLEFASKIELGSVDFIASIEDCGIVSDSCGFAVDENKFIIESKGLNSARSEFSGDEAKIDGENCKVKYSLEYLQKFIKASKLSEKTSLKFATDHPLRMDVRTDHIELSFILAPRVETDD
ncbi:hypothetical protein ACFL0X_00725 [Nanoarchaeota archaeon]